MSAALRLEAETLAAARIIVMVVLCNKLVGVVVMMVTIAE